MRLLLDFSSDFYFYLLLLFLFLIPFSIAACSILFGLLLLGLLASCLRERRLPVLPPFFRVFLLFAGLSLLTTFFSVDPGRSLAGNKELLRFLVVPLALACLGRASRRRLALAVVLLSSVLSALIGVLQWLRRGAVLDQRLKGLTSHWMTFAGLLMLAFVYFAVLWLLSDDKRRSWWLPPLLAVILAVIGLSLTRSAWVGIAVALLSFLLLCRPKWLAAALPVLLVFLLLAPSSVRQRLRSIVDPEDPSNRDRIHMLHAGWRMFADHPLTGVGTNNVGALYPAYRHPRAAQDNPHLHNNFLQVLAERGIFAALAFAAAWVVFFVDLARRIRGRRQRPRLAQTALAALFCVVAFLVAGMFEYNFGDGEVRYLLLFFMTLPFLPDKEDEDDHKQAPGRDLLSVF